MKAKMKELLENLELINDRKEGWNNALAANGNPSADALTSLEAMLTGLDVDAEDLLLLADGIAAEQYEAVVQQGAVHAKRPSPSQVAGAMTGSWLDGVIFGMLLQARIDMSAESVDHADDETLIARALNRVIATMNGSSTQTPEQALGQFMDPDVFRDKVLFVFTRPEGIDIDTSWVWATTHGFMIGWHMHAEKDAALDAGQAAA